MKLYYSILMLILIPVLGFAQSSNRLTGVKSSSISDDRLFLEQHLWSYSKGKSRKSEKPLIDFNTIDNWRVLGYYLSVSNNGNFFAYTIIKPTGNKPNGTLYWGRREDSLVVQSTRNDWRMAFADSKRGFFTANSEKYIFQNGEILYFLQLGKSQTRSVKGVISYKISQHGKNEWLAYHLKSNDSNFVLHNLVTGREKLFSGVTEYNFNKSGEWLICKRANELLLYNLVTGTERHFPFVVSYSFASNGKALLLNTIEKKDNGVTIALRYLGAPDWKERIIWLRNKQENDIKSYSVDNSGRQVIFTQDSAGMKIWYYNADTDIAVVKVTNSTPGISEEKTISGDVSFSDNGRYIKFFLQSSPDNRKPNPEMAQVEVWAHKDLYLQSAQAELSKEPEMYIAFVNIENGKVMPLESDSRKLRLQQGDFAVVKKNLEQEYGDRFWETGTGVNNDSNWLVSLNDGSYKLLPTSAGDGKFWFSPGGKYLIYFDIDKDGHYFSYNLHDGVLKDISANVPVNQLGIANRYGGNKPKYGCLAGWLENDAGVLVYDNYDIWKLDTEGKEPANCITNGLGLSGGIMFNLLETNRFFFNEFPVLKINEPILFRAFNTRNKQSGFYRKAYLNAGTPKLVYMGNYFMNSIEVCHDPNLSNIGMAPVKAKDRETWIVQRQSSSDAPNYYETKDFYNFKRLTNFQPQQQFSWLSEELHSFKHLDGLEGQGILYKPESFDSTKKYPVLIVFYGAFSNNLNQFHDPSYISQAIEPGQSPVWLVNNGYLVFTPDIYTTPHKYGASAFNVIEGAAKYLKQLPYVDGNKLGCASHSWSAKLGAYLFTHSQSFNATAISEGILYANPIDMAFSTRNSRSWLGEVEIDNEYGNLYENKETWLEQTTVLQADKAKSPLLLFCNKESLQHHQNQTLQLFTALRRLEKAVWWLKYDNGAHTLTDLKELRDYTIRYTQFLDHYLKEAPAPLWMTQGLPLMAKGIESRYELDPKGSCVKDCKVCKKWNEQYEKHPEIFKNPIQEWHFE